jgi:serine/threonine protein kinase
MNSNIARRIGNYEIEGLLGEGGVGQVYAARDLRLDRPVAIKKLRPEFSLNRNLMDRFHVEARNLARLSHPNITTLHTLELDGAETFMVMERVRGHTLELVLSRTGCLPLRESRAILAQVIAGLDYAHRQGVFHRDIKPSNLMITDAGVLKIMDFGLARVRGSQQITRTGEFHGTLAYASPEQITGDKIDHRTDIYSLGISFYKMVVGVAPFFGDSDYALMTAHLQLPPPPLAGRVALLDETTEAALMKALSKDPENRFSSVEEFGQALGIPSLRGQAVEIVQNLYAEVFRDGPHETTRIIPARPRSEPALPRQPERERKHPIPGSPQPIEADSDAASVPSSTGRPASVPPAGATSEHLSGTMRVYRSVILTIISLFIGAVVSFGLDHVFLSTMPTVAISEESATLASARDVAEKKITALEAELTWLRTQMAQERSRTNAQVAEMKAEAETQKRNAAELAEQLRIAQLRTADAEATLTAQATRNNASAAAEKAQAAERSALQKQLTELRRQTDEDRQRLATELAAAQEQVASAQKQLEMRARQARELQQRVDTAEKDVASQKSVNAGAAEQLLTRAANT